MSWPRIIERIENGESVQIRPAGNSMTPIIKSKELVTLEALTEDPAKGDVVLAKVKGRFYLHKVTSIDGDRYQISNNHGHVNGWSRRNKIFAKVTRVDP